jgi:hypothetical protein
VSGLRFQPFKDCFSWIMDSQPIRLSFPRHIPRSIPCGYQSYRSTRTRRILSCTVVASLCTKLLSHQQDWPCGLSPALIPCGEGLERFCSTTGEGFCFVIFSNISNRMIGRGLTRPRRVLTVDVLLHEGPALLGSECFTPTYAFACGYLQSLSIHEYAYPYQEFMGNALSCSLGLIPSQSYTMLAMVRFSLPGVMHCFQPALPASLLTLLRPSFSNAFNDCCVWFDHYWRRLSSRLYTPFDVLSCPNAVIQLSNLRSPTGIRTLFPNVKGW